MDNKKFRSLNESARRVMSSEKEPTTEDYKELIEQMLVLEQSKDGGFNWRDLFRPIDNRPGAPINTPMPWDKKPVEDEPYEPTDQEKQDEIERGLRSPDGNPIMASNDKIQAYMQHIKDNARK